MNKLTKELVDDSSFEFLSNYLDVDLRENRESYKEIISYIIILTNIGIFNILIVNNLNFKYFN